MSLPLRAPPCLCFSLCLCFHSLALSSLYLCSFSVSVSFSASLAFPRPRGCGHGKLSLGVGTSVLVLAKATSVNTGHPAALGKEVEASAQGPPFPHPIWVECEPGPTQYNQGKLFSPSPLSLMPAPALALSPELQSRAQLLGCLALTKSLSGLGVNVRPASPSAHHSRVAPPSSSPLARVLSLIPGSSSVPASQSHSLSSPLSPLLSPGCSRPPLLAPGLQSHLTTMSTWQPEISLLPDTFTLVPSG